MKISSMQNSLFIISTARFVLDILKLPMKQGSGGARVVFKRIKDLREDSDLTQARLGKMLNISQRAYAYYESGERMIPPSVIISLAKFYGVSTDYILGLTDIKEPYPKSKTGGVFK